MRVCLFEDQGVSQLEPLSLNRPVFDLLCGQSSLGSKQCAHFTPNEVGALIRPYLASLYHLRQPGTPVNDLTWLRGEPTILVNGRWLPPLDPPESLAGPCVGMVGDEVAYVILGPDRLTYCSPNTLEDCLETWKNTLPHQPAGGRMIHYLWDLVEANAEQIKRDFYREHSEKSFRGRTSSAAVVGPRDQLLVDPTAELDPMVVIDTVRGPVVIDREAVVTAFSRLEGPCYVGAGTHVLGAKIRAGTTLGHNCRVGGEVEASILQGNTNKYHDGFLGHSYVGEWVNLGAGTQNSDLRNDYGRVSVSLHGDAVATGLTKVGCFLGDHTKTGLGTLLNTGTIAGIFCNLLPANGFLPKAIPSFCSWWKGQLRGETDLAGLWQTATVVMRRRQETFTDIHSTLYHLLFDQTDLQRARALGGAEKPLFRRSA